MAQDTPLVSAQRPALEKLARWVGVWEGTIRYRWTPESPVFESHVVESTQWSANHNFLITDQRATMPDGSINTVAITTWAPAQKLYRMARISAGGETEQLTMSLEGGVRTIVGFPHIGDRMIRCEATMEDISPTETKGRCECTDRGTNWLFSEGNFRKTK